MLSFNPHDPSHILLAQNLWDKLHKSGDLEGLFMDAHVTTSFQLTEILSPPNFGFLDFDDDGVWFAVWFSPWLNAAWMGLWCREDMRHSMKFHKNLFPLMREAFNRVPVIMGVTQKPEILEIHKKLGYDISIVIPELFKTKPGWIVQLHKDQFRFLEPKKTTERETLEVV